MRGGADREEWEALGQDDMEKMCNSRRVETW